MREEVQNATADRGSKGLAQADGPQRKSKHPGKKRVGCVVFRWVLKGGEELGERWCEIRLRSYPLDEAMAHVINSEILLWG